MNLTEIKAKHLRTWHPSATSDMTGYSRVCELCAFIAEVSRLQKRLERAEEALLQSVWFQPIREEWANDHAYEQACQRWNVAKKYFSSKEP